MDFAARLKELRLRKELSQNDLANILGLSKSTISMYERGEREPDFETLESIADFFNVDMNHLLGNDDGSMYYLDPEVAEIAQAIKENPGKRALFDATRDVSKEDIEKVLQIINVITKDD